ncbi:CaiB/BaiF CoA-transferase family protein [Limnohabitans sp. T6-20]|uniref:CaiB/BaiF CoA transferase family protein n=1 Tax=Limnohabitans sp. T6-20 TaxID=1100725 RepID=UPI000D3DB813|nr:CaiB/BaiF CoA-transferase family protein [Limnohabitans sp. T6-20]PUE12641.1 carnitine dehydratase [Limnohabitans sp. T6-20]
MAGPLTGMKVIEMAGIGPGPFCAMVLADLGADVVRVARPGVAPDPLDVLARSRMVLNLDLREPQAVQEVLSLVAQADVLIEGFRPGVMERLGLGPDVCLARQPRLVYGRMTGWGQHGPLAHAAGHDINYIAISGALHAIGREGEAPVPPLNYVGDFGGGAMLLAVGILAALHETRQSGRGQVVDAAMTDGAALLSSMMYGFKAAGQWSNHRGDNMLDGGAFFYDTYACADGRHVAVGAIEPQFYALLREKCGIANDPVFDAQMDRQAWPVLKLRLAEVFRTRTRDEWCALLEGTDACFAPVLDWDEAPEHPHNRARQTFTHLQGVLQPAPAPRFDRTPADAPHASAVSTPDAVRARWQTAI